MIGSDSQRNDLDRIDTSAYSPAAGTAWVDSLAAQLFLSSNEFAEFGEWLAGVN